MSRLLISSFLGSVLLLSTPLQADQFVTGQAADVVLGQTNFTDTTSGASASKFNQPQGVAIDPTTGKVFVAEAQNFRVLRFSSLAAATTGGAAEAVFGQPDLTSNTANQGGLPARNTLGVVIQIDVDHLGRLWVCDASNHRVLCYLSASIRSNNPDADYVFGQPDFVTFTSGRTQSKFNLPCGVTVGADDTLWISDTNNHRVLRFANVSSKSSGALADGVLGQTDFTNGFFGPTTTNLFEPFGIATDSAGRLWVADSKNNRILRFDDAVTVADANGGPASGVLGQTDFGSMATALTATGMNGPFGLLPTADGTLWVGDSGNKRILGYRNAAAKGNGAAADLVIGQPDFITNGTTVNAFRLTGPSQFSEGPGKSFFVSESVNHRVLRFSPVKSPVLTISTRSSATTNPTFRIRGKVSGQVTKVTYRVGRKGGFRRAAGGARWSFTARLKPGKNLITVMAEGPGGTSAAKKVTITRN